MPVKKTAKAKKTAAKKTSASKSRPASKKTTAKSKGPAKKTAAKKSAAKKSTPAKKSAAKNVKKPATKKKTSNRGGFNRELNEETGFVVGTDSDTIALALLEGGESRADIIAELEGVLDTETRNGTEKQVTNMVSGVLNKMLAAGYTVEQSFVVVPPTPASKRKAARKK